MEVRRKVYYDKQTGNVLLETSEMSGSVQETTVDEDFKAYLVLQQRVKDAVGIIQLQYGQLADKFSACTGYNVDITKNTIDASSIIFSFTTKEANLEEVKLAKINELETDCTKTKDGGFTSSCLGTEKTFDSSAENRSLIIGLSMKAGMIVNGATLPNASLDWKAVDEPVCYSWTPQQMIILGVDMSTFLTTTIKKKELLQQYVNTLTTIDDVNKVTWDTVISN